MRRKKSTHTQSDNLSREQRSYAMSRVKSRNTSPELLTMRELRRRKLRFRKHVRHMAGCPDIVFVDELVAVFIDGDFWHGYRYPAWRHKLSPFWQRKIETNRIRDRRVSAMLRRRGWHVMRIWEHEIEAGVKLVVDELAASLTMRSMSQVTSARSRRRQRQAIS